MNHQTRHCAIAGFATFLLSLTIIAGLTTVRAQQSTRARKGTQKSQKRKPQPQRSFSCPPPTVDKNGVCTLGGQAVVTLQNTLMLDSGTILDCEQGRISPTGYDPAKPYANPSSPQVGIFLYDVKKVTIKNCHLEGFDFGIFVMNSKVGIGDTSTNNSFTNNIILAHYTPISLLSVDNTDIAFNTMTFTQVGGRGITVQRDSDKNNIHHNTIKADLDLEIGRAAGAYMAPAPRDPKTGAFVSLTSNPFINDTTKPHVVFIGQLAGPDPALLTAVINGIVYQLYVTGSTPVQDFSAGNIFDTNTLDLINPNVPYDGIVLALPQKTLVRDNTISGNTRSAIRVGSQMASKKDFPGTCGDVSTGRRSCNNDPTCKRSCLDDRDCNIPGVDTFDANDPSTLSRCQGVQMQQSINWTSTDNTLDHNIINGPFDMGILTASDTMTIQRNIINGPSRVPGKGGGILLLGKLPLETAIVTRNKISNVTPALVLTQTFQLTATTFSAKIGLNDFTGWNTGTNTPAVLVNAGYNLRTELSLTEGGNYWGVPCSVPLVILTDASPPVSAATLVTDILRVERPIAFTPEQQRPQPCSHVVWLLPFRSNNYLLSAIYIL